jgi:hypothetical protein
MKSYRTATGAPATGIARDVLGRAPRGPAGTPALAFGITVPFSRSRGPTPGRPRAAAPGGGRRADTHSAAAWSGCGKSVRVKRSSRRDNPPASGPISVWVEALMVKRLSDPARSRRGEFFLPTPPGCGAIGGGRAGGGGRPVRPA